MHVETLTHDSMNAGKGAKRTTSGSASKKTTYSDEINHAVVSLLPKEDDSSRWVSTLAPLPFLKAARKHAVTLNENRMLYNVSDAPKTAMVTPSIVNFRLQKRGGKDDSKEGLIGVETLWFRTVMPCLTVKLLPSRPKKPYNRSTSTPKHQRKTQHLHQDCNICTKLTRLNTSGAYTAGF